MNLQHTDSAQAYLSHPRNDPVKAFPLNTPDRGPEKRRLYLCGGGGV